jgi:FkbM family methyltransferase|tara:strand:- start:116 stop:790 length:675 start_codon:yes stop_codon:yes gene_type:complete
VFKKLLRGLGYDLRHRRWTPTHLAGLVNARTVIDVGVGFGTWELYRAFPKARFLLVEPLRDYEEHLEHIAAQYRCDIVYKALGATEQECEIHVDPSILTRSSLHARTKLTDTGSSLETRRIEMTTLDSLSEVYADLEGPILLKIDTEGYELEVIKGGDEFLRRIDVVIAEVSVAPRFEGAYGFAELIAAMDQRGFEVFDFLRLSYVRGGAGTQFADIAFKRKDV